MYGPKFFSMKITRRLRVEVQAMSDGERNNEPARLAGVSYVERGEALNTG